VIEIIIIHRTELN